MNLTIGEIVEATGGQLLRGNAQARPVRVCTDTRILQPGDLYVAIRGGNFDGEEFVGKALAAGAAAVLTTREWRCDELPPSGCVIRVQDAVAALGDLARAWRERIDPLIVAITGSSGKTTTKDMAAHLCAGRLPLLSTEGNKNNHIGLPLTLMRLREGQTAAVVELGMNHSGEIEYLTRIAMPDIGVLTNIGDAHLGNFANQDTLIDAKGELFSAMSGEGTAIVNADCANTAKLRARGRFPRQVITFGESKGADIRARDVKMCKPFGYEFTIGLFEKDISVYLPVFGRYQIENALAAAAAALLAGVTPEEIVERFATFRPAAMRSQVLEIGGIRVIEDCYNASPVASCAAIASFGQMEDAHRRIVLFGSMAELGEFSEEGHRRVGAATANAKIDMLYCIGPEAAWSADEASKNGVHAKSIATIEEAVGTLWGVMQTGDALLVKGSRASKMERAIELLRRVYDDPISPEVTV